MKTSVKHSIPVYMLYVDGKFEQKFYRLQTVYQYIEDCNISDESFYIVEC